jgi:hypothetical protein
MQKFGDPEGQPRFIIGNGLREYVERQSQILDSI